MGDGCTECGTTTAGIWRKHKETKARLCNRCYSKKWKATDLLPRPVVKEEPQEEARLIKQEVKEEIKAEIKEEVKAEVKDEVKLEAKSEVKASPTSRAKRRRHDEDEEDFATALNDPDNPSAETDTEYPEVDLNACPRVICVESSSTKTVDGRYRLMRASRGKPSYVMKKEDKHGQTVAVYLYWRDKKWMVGKAFGDKQFVCSLKDASLPTPCEPYPHAWKVNRKGPTGEKETAVQVAMRVFDAAQLKMMRQLEDALPVQLDEPAEDGFEPPEKKHRKPRHDPQETSKEQALAAKSGSGQVKSVEDETVNKADSSSEESSEERSDSSSSESEASENTQASPGHGDQASELKLQEQKMQEFEDRFRLQMSKLTDDDTKAKKYEQVRQFLLRKGAAGPLAGLDPEQMTALMQRLEKEFGGYGKNSAAGPRPPPGPPPKHLQAPSKPPPADTGSMAPSTPPDMPKAPQDPDLPTHRTRPIPTKSSMKRPFAPRTRSEVRVKYSDQFRQPLAQETNVTCYRPLGDHLWFYMPGSLVICDNCEQQVPQSMGSLQGAPNQSQFAQCQFICNECSSRFG
mmetsp:Transcript_42648/g.92957  ORF Transcript_42648/g.92957 Transcript_42648/m.92957 type:complete len:572 (+) Transcript_42648:159-1874(+)|eukprot:CAMPEP_0170582334 /NCGR_PEP_ID=MMETSP0224-20130122/7527_1 /TAXON_ID=285029 /ORGANISM="Togula jolla, Strain CCCM 725" /LENGTH=571 /DNA_ID=CAMNT_0010905549 /DNA_START=84 /DNA_END=1799 /DNA_ORIENTATION=-